jgi:hypothetical protein
VKVQIQLIMSGRQWKVSGLKTLSLEVSKKLLNTLKK